MKMLLVPFLWNKARIFRYLCDQTVIHDEIKFQGAGKFWLLWCVSSSCFSCDYFSYDYFSCNYFACYLSYPGEAKTSFLLSSTHTNFTPFNLCSNYHDFVRNLIWRIMVDHFFYFLTFSRFFLPSSTRMHRTISPHFLARMRKYQLWAKLGISRSAVVFSDEVGGFSMLEFAFLHTLIPLARLRIHADSKPIIRLKSIRPKVIINFNF